MLYLLILVPLFSVLALNLPFSKALADRLAFGWGLALGVLQVWLVLSVHWGAPHPEWDRLEVFFAQPPVLDSLSRVMFLGIGIVSLAALMCARYMIASHDRLFLFVNLILLSAAGMNDVVLAADLFSLYVFLEVVAVTSFILIAFERGREGYEGAFKYFILSAAASAMLLGAVGLFAMIGGGVSFEKASLSLMMGGQNRLVWLAVGLLVVGLMIKGGLVPFHGWLPDAYSSAPSGAAVLLAGIVTKTAGIYTLMRIGTSVMALDLPFKVVLLTFGTASLLVGALAALAQSDFRRMLAYSSISQVGYIVLGFAAGTPLGFAGAIFHLFNHAVFKGLLFVNACAVEKESGTRDMNALGGLGGHMPITSATSVVALLSTAGIPPLSGFWSKLMIVMALWQSGFVWIAVVAVLGSLITLAYFLSLQRRVFFGESVERLSGVKEAGFWAAAPAVLLAAVTIALGLAFPWLFNTFLVPVPGFL